MHESYLLPHGLVTTVPLGRHRRIISADRNELRREWLSANKSTSVVEYPNDTPSEAFHRNVEDNITIRQLLKTDIFWLLFIYLYQDVT